ncbi:MAG: von Willebrand factor type A domain-containing protein [Pseudomonadota bacterium]
MQNRWVYIGRYGLAASFAAVVSAITLLILSNTPEAVNDQRLDLVGVAPLPARGDGGELGRSGTDAIPYAAADANLVTDTRVSPISTFSWDIDTASYASVRRLVQEGVLPPPEAVRTQEMLNYFSYDYDAPRQLDRPFKADVALMPAPWRDDAQLLRIGIQGYEPPAEDRLAANLVFLVDASGSMASPDRLPLVRSFLRLLMQGLGPEDTVGIVAYGGSAGVLLEPTAASNSTRIEDALRRLQADGDRVGLADIENAYALAEAHYNDKKLNRVILATDGDFSIGTSNTQALRRLIERQRASGVSLSVLGVGDANLDDELMQALVQHGDGQAAYIDSPRDAHRVLVEYLNGTLISIAENVKIQVEFNPAQVATYRLLGYETRALEGEDRSEQRMDGDSQVGAGHQVTAMYEIVAPGGDAERLDSLPDQDAATDELAVVQIRYEAPGEGSGRRLDFPVTREASVAPNTERSRELAFAAAVAAFAQKLRADPRLEDYDYGSVMALAQPNRGRDEGDRREFVRLVRLADALSR